uniref:Uncharacterized protein n=1 Tax=Arion vulgaris TaxID=1028688 RepID=A0A0B7BA46_9EUPU
MLIVQPQNEHHILQYSGADEAGQPKSDISDPLFGTSFSDKAIRRAFIRLPDPVYSTPGYICIYLPLYIRGATQKVGTEVIMVLRAGICNLPGGVYHSDLLP